MRGSVPEPGGKGNHGRDSGRPAGRHRQLGQLRIEGWVVLASCTACRGRLVHYAVFDALFCPSCNRWTSLQCTIPECYLCSVRPERPLMRAEGSSPRDPAQFGQLVAPDHGAGHGTGRLQQAGRRPGRHGSDHRRAWATITSPSPPRPRRSACSTRGCAWRTPSIIRRRSARSAPRRRSIRAAPCAGGARRWCWAPTSTCRWIPRRRHPPGRRCRRRAPRRRRCPTASAPTSRRSPRATPTRRRPTARRSTSRTPARWRRWRSSSRPTSTRRCSTPSR